MERENSLIRSMMNPKEDVSTKEGRFFFLQLPLGHNFISLDHNCQVFVPGSINKGVTSLHIGMEEV